MNSDGDCLPSSYSLRQIYLGVTILIDPSFKDPLNLTFGRFHLTTIVYIVFNTAFVAR